MCHCSLTLATLLFSGKRMVQRTVQIEQKVRVEIMHWLQRAEQPAQKVIAVTRQ